jgi:hypothetical protein
MRIGRYPMLAATLLVLGLVAPGAASAVPQVKGPPAAPHTHPISGKLSSLSCATRSVCFAVDSIDKDIRWGVTRIVDKGALTETVRVKRNITLLGIDCPSSAGCTALAERDSDFASEVLTVGIRDSIGKPRVLGASSKEPLTNIACHPTRSHCIAIGGGDSTVQVVTIDGSKVTTHDRVLPARVNHLSILSIDCPTKAQCYAVGSAEIKGKVHGLVVPIHDGVAGRPTYIASASRVGLLGIACPSVKRCYALGFGHGSFIYTLDNAKLTHSVSAPQSMVLFGIACQGAHRCDAVGSRTAVKGVVLPLLNGNINRVEVTSVTPSYGSMRGEGSQGPIAGFRGGIVIAGVDASKQFGSIISSS